METVYARIKASGKVLITGNKEAYDTVFGFSWDFPEFSGQVRFITRPKSRTMRATRQLMLPPSTVS